MTTAPAYPLPVLSIVDDIAISTTRAALIVTVFVAATAIAYILHRLFEDHT